MEILLFLYLVLCPATTCILGAVSILCGITRKIAKAHNIEYYEAVELLQELMGVK